jgi:cytochrome c oxidase subunit II
MSTSTVVVNGSLIYILAFAALLFFLIVFFMIYFLIRYRHARNPVPSEFTGKTGFLEAGFITASLILVLTMFVYGLTGFNFLRNTPSNSLVVKVNARQWSWLFEYQNQKKSPVLVVPLGKNIKCDLSSADVIHGFYIPAFHIQQDTMPGLATQAWFRATTTGSYDIFCSQYCGLRHSEMTTKLIVVTQNQFDEWVSGETIAFPGESASRERSEGEKLLSNRGCLSCHSLGGEKMVGPTFKGLFGSKVRVITNGKTREVVADENYVRASITNPGADIADGYANIMPSGRDILTDDEINDIIDYLRTLR